MYKIVFLVVTEEPLNFYSTMRNWVPKVVIVTKVPLYVGLLKSVVVKTCFLKKEKLYTQPACINIFHP